MLPVLISIPHGGNQVPEELRDRVCITREDLFDDSDAFTREIYDLGDDVARVVKADVARAFVDMNRAPDDRPPQNPDGVVKAATCFGRPIYIPGREPDENLTERLVERYHAPYHAQLVAAAQSDMKLALDCHSMLSHAPPISGDYGRARPLFCLSNLDGATAPDDLLQELAAAIAAAFEIPLSEIGLNDPFKGGYITRAHGTGTVPWIQVEMNRVLYLVDPWFRSDTLTVCPTRLAELRARFRRALHRLAV
ncbi:MAG: N-formylglutamate amidohydrolase [Gemmatimonadota bacterium]|nr:MAG: N-formylglutamate amidohydrolase [Gemmatimonadota bacterium]